MAGLDPLADEAFTSQEIADPAVDLGPPVSIRSLKAAAKRRRRLWLASAFAGLLLGAGLHHVLPSKVGSVSKLYLVQPTGVDPTVAIANDVSLLETRKVAEAAMSELHLSPSHPLITYNGSSDGTTILEIKLSAPSTAEAVAWNDAVAQAFLHLRAQIQGEAINGDVASKQSQIRSLNAEIQRLGTPTSRIAQNEQNDDVAEVNTLNDEIAQDRETLALMAHSGVIDSAYVVAASSKKATIADGLSGLVAGLAIGLIIVIIGELLSDRVRDRADVAAALGAPVELSVGRFP
jgi:capsular polysaccharide biosynthesis protein